MECYIPRRYITVMMTCLGMIIIHAMRVNVAVTVVTILDQEPHRKVGTIEAITNLPNVMWDSRMVGFLHAIFYIGYLFTQLPGGYLAQKVPAHRLFGGCILISCALNLLLPVSIQRVGYALTCVIRGAQGLSEGLLFPSSYAIMRHWTTPHERSRMGAIVLTGVYTGPVIGLPIAGYLTHYFGWQYIYYANGAAGIVWFLVWIYLSYDRPSEHPTIKPEELKLIHDSQGETAIIYEHDTVPWKDIFSSVPVWALNVCNFARSWIFFLLLTNEPTYLNVFGFTIAENGVYSALPHIMMATIAAFSGPAADYLISDPRMTSTIVRKLFTGVGFGTEGLCCFMLGFITDGVTALIVLTIGVGISGFTISGWQINHLDIAPRYASVLVGLTTAAGTLAGILNPLIVGAMTRDQTMDQWHSVFILTSAVLIFAVIFYAIFGSGTKQSWAEPKPPEVQLIVKDGSKVPFPSYTIVPSQISEEALKENVTPELCESLKPNTLSDDNKSGRTSTNETDSPSVRRRTPSNQNGSQESHDTNNDTSNENETRSSVIPQTSPEPVQPHNK